MLATSVEPDREEGNEGDNFLFEQSDCAAPNLGQAEYGGSDCILQYSTIRYSAFFGFQFCYYFEKWTEVQYVNE